MEYSDEIQNAVDCVRHYSNKIDELARKQFSLVLKEHNPEPFEATRVIDLLGAIGNNRTYILMCCDGIEANLKSAEGLIKKLQPALFNEGGQE